jgi:uncharacterized membrane protein YcgQ (UPF0703/DUF1980 family)
MRLLWRRLQHWAAWLLIPLMLLQFLSGYAMLHWRLFGGVLSRLTAFKLHSIIQPLTLAATVAHGFPWIRRALAKRRIVGRWLDGALAVVGAGLIAFGSYLAIQG